ncbi:4037_t:CDS:2 [Ambispora gerdemannii]|uniref:4037_t:CDS:1 n=1 Tax=Ambispora gerdemannii TaxID=144530 RepID=A0A9N8VGV8_9GLOM|nr:4037_t:CDS:2 [Ambispora gerdemannii]
MSSMATTSNQDSIGDGFNINSQVKSGLVQDTEKNFIQQSGKGKEKEVVVVVGDNYDTNMSAASDENRRLRESSSSSNENAREMDESSNDTSDASSSDSKKSKISSSSTTDAWFQEFNSNVKELNQSFDEDDSETPYSVDPFQKSHPPSQSITSKHHSHAQTNHHPHRATFGRDNVGSARHGAHQAPNTVSAPSDSYRSVIDDLTLKNQRLRHKLRKMERLHKKSLHKEKLFEVRYFQMPRNKRHELEDYLKDFAAQLPTPPSSGVTSSSANSTSRTSSGPPRVIDNVQVKGSNKAKMKQVVQAIEKVFTTKPSYDDHYLKDQEKADPDGYVYLNLLTNMAQLHTMNVTLPLVKQSIRTFSNCLELSDDGTKVRWRSEIDPSSETVQNVIAATRFHSPSESSSNATSSSRNTTNSNVIAGKSPSNGSHTTVGSLKSSSISHYRPISGVEQPQEGPIIYYEGGVFCTDLSRVAVDFGDESASTSPSGFRATPSDSSGMENSTANGSRKESSNTREKRPVLRYERGTNIVLGSNPQILANYQTEEETSSGQEADDEDSAHPMLLSEDSKIQLTVIESDSVNGTANNNRKKDKPENTLGGSSFTENTGDEGSSSGGSGRVSSTHSPSSGYSKIPTTQMLATSGTSGVVPEDNFTVVVKTSHPWSFSNNKSPRRHKSSTSPLELIKDLNISHVDNPSNKPPRAIRRNNKDLKRHQRRHSHSIVSTELIHLPPSLTHQIIPPPLAVESCRTSYTNLSALGSSESGGSSGYGSSSSSQSLSEMSYDPIYALKNNTILALSRNRRESSSAEDEVQDMDLDSPSSDSSTLCPYINIDAEGEEHEDDEDSEIQSGSRDDQEPTIQEDQDGYYRYHKNKIEESQLGVNLRLREAAAKERRRLVTEKDDDPDVQKVRVKTRLTSNPERNEAAIAAVLSRAQQQLQQVAQEWNTSTQLQQASKQNWNTLTQFHQIQQEQRQASDAVHTHVQTQGSSMTINVSAQIQQLHELQQKNLKALAEQSHQLQAAQQNWNARMQTHQSRWSLPIGNPPEPIYPSIPGVTRIPPATSMMMQGRTGNSGGRGNTFQSTFENNQSS